jgi:hypothetical protein
MSLELALIFLFNLPSLPILPDVIDDDPEPIRPITQVSD